jgi:uncharacterized protein YndB with AHSA1/START domain
MKSSTTEAAAVVREVTIEAPPEAVWEFLADPAKLTRWMGTRASIEARPGAELRVEVLPGHVASGRIVEVDAPRRLVTTWGWEPGKDGTEAAVPPGSSTVTIELEPAGDGTLVRLTHGDLPGAEAAESHATGWAHYLDRLAIVAAGGDPGRDPWLDGPATEGA